MSKCSGYTGTPGPIGPPGGDFVYKVIGINSMYDGDSIKVKVLKSVAVLSQELDFGFGDIITIPTYTIQKEIDLECRMYGFDTPELRDKRPDFKAAAYLAKEKARAWMNGHLMLGGVWLVSHKTSKNTEAKGKFGRYLASFMDMSNRTLGDYLIGENVAVPYHGQNKAEVEQAHLDNISILKSEGLI